jgi:hypothetical protein
MEHISNRRWVDALFGIGKALIRGAEIAVSRLVRVVLEELDRSQIGQVIVAQFGTSSDSIRRAKDIAEEEAELAEKARRDGRQRESDYERQQTLEREREKIRQEYEAAKQREAAENIRREGKDFVAPKADSDEYAASIGLVTLKKDCPTCGAPMQLKHGARKDDGGRDFWWTCTEVRPDPCPWAPFDPAKVDDVSMFRPPDPDLDVPAPQRRSRWTEPKTVEDAHTRLRKHIGESDQEILCPHHLLPTKLLPLLRAGGALLDSYQYACMGIRDGKACAYSVEVNTFPQISAALKRLEGQGILG